MLFAFLASVTSAAQTFDLEQFEQVFRPRLRLDGRWLPTTKATNRNNTFEDRSGAAALTFPITRTFNVNAQLDLTADSWKDLLLSGIRVRASQVMGTVRYGYREVSFQDGFAGPRSLHTGALGLMGISLTKRFRILFWNANVNVSEENATLKDPALRFTGMIGKMRVKGLHRQFFYGLFVIASDGLIAPMPFIGGQVPIAKKLAFNYVLPVQMNFAWRPTGGTSLQAGAGLDGWRSGATNNVATGEGRLNLNYLALRGFISGRKKLNNTFVLRADVGYSFHYLSYTVDRGEFDRIQLQPGLTATVGLNILFGKSVVEQILNDLLH